MLTFDSELLASLQRGVGVPAQIKYSDGYLISSLANGSLVVFDETWLKEQHRFVAHPDALVVILKMTGALILTGASDGLLKSWNARSGGQIQEVTTRYNIIRAIETAQDMVVSVSTNETQTAIEVSRRSVLTLNQQSSLTNLSITGLPFP